MPCVYRSRVFVVALTLFSASALADWSHQSGSTQTALVELYTSQGCSSCPPADRWLSMFKDRDDLWTSVVPVAWHVTYWDYLGWRDPFGRRENDQRQRHMATAAASGVYTPGMFLNGSEYRYWRGVRSAEVASGAEQVGELHAKAKGSQVTIRFEPSEAVQLKAPSVELVFLRSDRTTDVKHGENRGRKLQHDFIAGVPSKIDLAADGGVWVGNLSKRPDEDAVAVALWVTNHEGRYLQATGGWLNH